MDNKSTNEPLQQSNLSSLQPGEISHKSFPRRPTLLVVLFIVTGIGLIVDIASKTFFQPKPPVQVVTPKPTQTLPSDPTAGWKIYENKKLFSEYKRGEDLVNRFVVQSLCFRVSFHAYDNCSCLCCDDYGIKTRWNWSGFFRRSRSYIFSRFA